MNKETYIKALKQRLRRLPAEEIENAVEYVSEYFDEAISEEEAAKELGSPHKLAGQIIADYTVKNMHNDMDDYRSKPKSSHSLLKSIGLIFLGIFSLPIAIPVLALILVGFILLGVFIFVGFILLLCVVIIFFSSFILLFSGIYIIISASWINGFMAVGLALLCMGIGGLIFCLVRAFFKGGLPWITKNTGKLYAKMRGESKYE